MKSFTCWGILREVDHSPDRESDDEKILRTVAKQLNQKDNFEVKVFSPDEITGKTVPFPDLIFYMCEKEAILDLLEEWEARGVILVNTPKAVRNSFRKNTFELLSKTEYFPSSTFITTDTKCEPPYENGVWVKRGDYHAIIREDVLFAKDKEAFLKTLERFKNRNIKSVLLQEHVEGDLIKFYGVKDVMDTDSRWFHWFYHKDQVVKNNPLDKEILRKRCNHASELLNIEIYGGDAIIASDGNISIIDVNAWPSFALFRKEAATHITDLIKNKLTCSVSNASEHRIA